MAVVTITAREVRPLPGAIVREYDAGATGNVGDLVYVDSNGKAQPADGSAAGTARARGLVVAAGSMGKTTFAAGDRLSVVVFGPVAGFSGMTPGNIHYVSDTTGKVDTAAGTVSHTVGYAEAAGVLFVQGQDA